jgi:hypothetical protein
VKVSFREFQYNGCIYWEVRTVKKCVMSRKINVLLYVML